MPSITNDRICRNVITDMGRLYDAVAVVRDVYVSPSDRRPLNFDICERRSASRVPLCIPVTVRWAAKEESAVALSDESIQAEAIELAVRGLSFCHTKPLPGKLCTVTVELPAGRLVTFLLSVVWTTNDDFGGVRSGGRFLGIVEE